MKEVWRLIPSLPDYLASSHGRLMRLPYLGKMPYGGFKQYGGDPTFGVASDGNGNRPKITYKGKNYRVSRLVCEAFHGPASFEKAVVMHLDDNPANNAPSNLKWGTQKENLNTESHLVYLQSRTGSKNPRVIGLAKAAASQ